MSTRKEVEKGFDDTGYRLETEAQAYLAPRLGQDFGYVRVHDGEAADRAVTAVHAVAFTVGRHVVFGRDRYRPRTNFGLRLLAHELSHVPLHNSDTRPFAVTAVSSPTSDQERWADEASISLQNHRQGSATEAGVVYRAPTIQLSSLDNAEKSVKNPGQAPTSPAHMRPGLYNVIVIGSPGPGELPGHAFQFVDAAASANVLNPVWLVERTGYDLGDVDLGGIISRAGKAPVFWITPETPLTSLLAQFPRASVSSLHVFSHGIPGTLTLRYGWPTDSNYGLTRTDARALAPTTFTPDARLSFDSCNTATDPSFFPGVSDDNISLAQAVADATGRPVEAWVGRTSYRKVNRGQGGVTGSQIWPPGTRRPDLTELASQLRGRRPKRVITAPSSASGDWSGWFRMRARLPRSRRFPVQDHGSLIVQVASHSEYASMHGATITVLLHREVDWRADEKQTKQRAFVGQEATLNWTDLRAGTYYLELFHLSGLEVEGTLNVQIR